MFSPLPIDIPIVITLSLYFAFWQRGFPESSNFASLFMQVNTRLRSFMFVSKLLQAEKCVNSVRDCRSLRESRLLPETLRMFKLPCNNSKKCLIKEHGVTIVILQLTHIAESVRGSKRSFSPSGSLWWATWSSDSWVSTSKPSTTVIALSFRYLKILLNL